MTPRIFISGPMTGLPDFNYPAFHRAAAYLRSSGWQVENPAELFGGDMTLPRAHYVREDIIRLSSCTAMGFLPGWQRSQGARLEWRIGRALGLVLYGIVEGPYGLVPLERQPAFVRIRNDETKQGS